MLFSTIGRCAVIQLVFSLVASTPPTAADQFFRGSRLHRTVDGCTSFTEKSSCLAGTAGCTWHPQDGCVSASSTTETSERVFLTGGEEKNNGDDEASLRVSRKLQKVKATQKPTSNPPTRTPSSKPTAKPSATPSSIPTSIPTTSTPTSLPSSKPTATPSATTDRPTSSPTQSPTTRSPTGSPTFRPTQAPTAKPTLTPTNQPTSRPSTDRPTSKPTNQPSNAPTTAAPTTRSPTNQPSRKPTNSPVLPYNSTVLSCPLPGSTMIVITPGVKQVTAAAADTFCGIFLRKESESGNLIPLARSYHGKDWESAPGPLASPTENVNATTIILPELQDANDRYVILTKDGFMPERKQIAKFLEMTTFGPKRSEIDAIAAEWTLNSAAKRESYIRSQIDLPATSHREYWRKRANSKWDATAQPARSDHPCSPNSKWRKYSYIPQDRYHTNTDAYIYTTFETVTAEANFTTTIYEADSAAEVKNQTPGLGGGSFWNSAPTTSTYGYSGIGFYDMGGTNDYLEFTVNVPSTGLHPISFRFSQGSSSFNGNRKLQLQVNGVIVRASYDFIYTGSWAYWKYSEMIVVNLNAGNNTIKVVVVDQSGGPNIDHLRIGKPPAIVLKSNGWPRVIARNGLHLLNAWPYQFTNTTQVYFRENPDPPQGGLYRYPSGRLRVTLPDGRERYLDIGNPSVNFNGYEQYLPQNVFTFDGSEIWDETASDLYPYPMKRGQELLLRNGFNGAICDLIPPFAEEYDAPIFGKLPSGEYLQWTPQIQLEDNGPSINDPPGNRSAKVLVDGGGEAFVATDEKLKCSNVQRSFINEDTCFLSSLSTACSATNPVGEVFMPVNTTIVLDLYDLTGREIYAIQGLVMESITESPCAKTRSRWVVQQGTTCSAPSALGTNTITALTAAITASINKNEYVTDVDRTLACNPSDFDHASDPINIQLQVGPDCYTHVHPDHLNVYDFTGWVTNHPGGPYHIQKWAQGWEGHPGWYLIFPFYGNITRRIPEHPMNRWVTRAKEPDIVKVARLGDNIAYRDLPSELKTDAVAEYFGATPKSVTDGGVVVCGSMGEVSNDPSLTEIFDVRSNELTFTGSEALSNQKKVVWTEIALYGNDQLRQRMAWALAQIITTVPANIDAFDMTEIYTKYYDIFVKHAFGNFRDILAETSYSPLMAEHLSYLKSKSHSYVYEVEKKRVAQADENFAREVMQLFSMGLIVLNDDGTPVLDPSTGNPLETYTNEDIESFARAWTGFDRTAARGNYEESRTGTADNRLDPMHIVPEYRDPFPKSNLNGGFIGDGYLLCTDLPAKSFLKKGAVYRLLGGKPSPELMKDPSFFTSTTPGEILRAELNPLSQLYQRLYNAGDFQLSVTLENDLVCLLGTLECLVDTLRIVKVGSIYYEFVERPCVQLGFYNNGKQVQLRDSWRRGQMCANSDLAHAREACCREDRVDEVNAAVMVSNVTYFYDGERMKYVTARDRCVAYGRDLCLYDWLESKPVDNSNKKGYHWTNKDCAINVKVNSGGYIAIVHDAISSYTDTIPWLVEETNTLNWFRVFWDGNGDYPGSSETNTCEANNCKVVTSDDGSSSCLCKAIVTESVVFSDMNVSKENVMAQLFIGALGPQAGSTAISLLDSGLTIHRVGNVTDHNTVFEVQDRGRTMYLKNMRSTVSLEGWTMAPQTYEAENANISNAAVKNDTSSATGKKYVNAANGNETTYIQWNVAVPSAGEYLISLRYAHENSPRPLDVYVNTQLVARPLVNPNSLRPFANVGSDPAGAQLPLQRCAGDCDNNAHCMPGLFCMQNNGLERVPGCNGTQVSYDYCVDINDFDYGFTLLPTGGWVDDWHISKPLKVNLSVGQNTIRVQLPPKYREGPNIDYLKVEGLPVSSSPPSFRNPPHFMSLIPDYGSGRISERNLRDAQYETDAVLDYYFYHDNVAPFICVRVMQRFSFSNPSPRFISRCVEAFRTGLYTTESDTTFGSGKYGSLEAMIASILLDSEATEGSISVDPSYGSIKEPILKVTNLMRSMDYRTAIPTPIDNTTLQTTYNAKLWLVEKKIGQGPYDFPTVFSFFLPNYVPESGPNLPAKLTSPESVLVTMPNIVSFLNGMFSLIKYGLSDCNGGFSLYNGYGSCVEDGSYQRSFGRLFYNATGENDFERANDLALLLTAGRLSSGNLDKIVAACSSKTDWGSKNRCMMQLIVVTGEFHSTNTITQSGEERVTPVSSSTSTEPYKAIVYFYLSGGLDSYHMLAPHTCAPIDVYERFRIIRGKSDIAEGVGLPLTRLLEISANNAAQPCSSFGIHENLPVLKTLYDQEELIFIANAGLLAKPVTAANYYAETPVQLFAHDAITHETSREDLHDVYAGTGVGGRMANVFTEAGIPTNLFSIDGQRTFLTGEPGGLSQFILSSSGLSGFNSAPSIANMDTVIKALNSENTADSGFNAETWSSKLSEALDRHKLLKDQVDMTNVTTLFPIGSTIADQLKLVTRLMQTRVSRGIKRDIFYVQDGGYDTHADVDANLVINFSRINNAIQAFVNELKVLNLWESTTVVQFSEFARTLNPNTGDGSDHAWGGNHFMFGGALKGGKVLGHYPSDFNESEMVLSRGRTIPDTPWDAMWLGTAEWFGIPTNKMLEVLPMHKNFPPSTLYNKTELFDSLFV